ncbi:MAG: sugar ABC transporter ATP-binding protein [Anaerolineae bacterium]|nr:sugar ABC transporter ATP-binding protein [Anaerolineae bacterium]
MTQSLQESPPILEMTGITKRFPGVLALNRVNFSVKRGEIHSLIGQNGAGKSTLMKILAGVYSADEGTICMEEQPIHLRHPSDSLNKGIAIVYQELSLLPNLTVAQNIFLGREPGKWLLLDNKTIFNRSRQILESVGIDHIDIHTKIADIPLAQRQLVEIAKALSHNPKVLILDEPTAPLTGDDTKHLFDILKRLRSQGVAIIFITHRLKEVITYCDRGTVLRNGQTVGCVDIHNTSESALIEMMIGQKLENFYRSDTATKHLPKQEVVLEVQGLSVGKKVRDVTFQVRRGEIIGITGLLGAGQNELARALFGIENQVAGVIRRNGKPVRISSPSEAIYHGICLLTENRKEEGLILEMSVKENMTLPSLAFFRLSKWIPVVNHRKEHSRVEEFIRKVNIVTRSANTRLRTLSGGNQQKTIVARWLLRNLEILLFIEPTRGIDVGAKAEIYRLLSSLANEGKSIIVVSTDHVEVMGISDRVFVMYKGRLAKIFDKVEVSEEKLLFEIQGGVPHD